MRKIIRMLLIGLMLLTLVACGKKEDATASQSPDSVKNVDVSGLESKEPAKEAVNEAVLGFYEGTGYDVQGQRFDPAGEWFELKADGTGSMSLGPEETPFEWTLSGDEISIKTVQQLSYKALVDGDDITLDTGMLYYFSKGEGAASQASEIEQPFMGVDPMGNIMIPSEWYGVAIITESTGFDIEDGQYDVWGWIDSDSSGSSYFELYLVEEPTEGDFPIISMYIDETELDQLTPIIRDGDGWVLDLDLDESDELQLLTMYDQGMLDINYICDDGSRYANCRFFVREKGTQWKEEVDPLPETYPDYVRQYY